MAETKQSAQTRENVVHATLKKLIDEAQVTFKAEDVLRQFRVSEGKRDNKKLVKIMEILSRHKPKSAEYLKELEHYLEKKDPIYCLIRFLNHYADTDMMHTGRKKDVPTSTPLIIKKDTVEESSVAVVESKVDIEVKELKERVVQAATSSVSSTCLPQNVSSTLSISASSPSRRSVFQFIRKETTSSIWEHQIVEQFNFPASNVTAVPLKSQENMLLYDLIYALTGMRGCFITPEEHMSQKEPTIAEICRGIKFIISDQIHSSLRDIATEILELAYHYTAIEKFIQTTNFTTDCGQVLQAFGAALRSIVHDYYLLLAQLETEMDAGELTLHKMLFYIRPTLDVMQTLSTIVTDILEKELRGGQVLTLLNEKINSLTGTEEIQKFVIKLAKEAAAPYMEILRLWIQKGVIIDPQNEFLVEDNEVVRREELPEHYSADYWEKRYTICPARIPCFLASSADTILCTGKYLNVIRQCGKKVTPPQDFNLQFSPINENYVALIIKAYHFASQNLLQVLVTENDLIGHLMSVKRYLLLQQGDFITQFMDSCEEELAKNVDDILPMKLENLLGLTLRLSSAKHDAYKDDVHCELLTYDLVTQMSKIMKNEGLYWQTHDRLDLTGLECFAFRYEVQWPISLVINHIAMSKYQMLFRQLFYCKHVERQLCRIWKENGMTKKFSQHAASLYRPAFVLRSQMMSAVQNLEYYMMIEVIEPYWHNFIEKMKNVQNVEEVLTLHQDFLDACLKNCMMTETVLLNRYIFKLLKICLNFCEFIQKSDEELDSFGCECNVEENSDSECVGLSQKQPESSIAPSDTFSERIKRFELEFTGALITMLKQINQIAIANPSDRFINLVHRINFNLFYSDQMEKLCVKESIGFDKS